MLRSSDSGRSAEPLILALIGFALIVAGMQDLYAMIPVGRTGVLSFTLPIVSCQYGVLLCLIGMASYAMGFAGKSIGRELWSQCGATKARLIAFAHLDSRAFPIGVSSIVLCVAVATTIGAGLRLWYSDQPMRYDEAFAFNTFIRDEKYSVFYYPLPNNHVLYSLLEYLSWKALGASPLALRMPALLFGIGLIPLVFGVCRKLGQGRSTGIAACGTAVFPFLVSYSTNGRGYSLLAFTVTLLIYLALDANGRATKIRAIPLALVAAAGMLVMPSMLYALGGFTLWLSCLIYAETRSWKDVLLDVLLPFATFTAALTLLFYLPVALVSGGLQAVTSNRFVVPLPAAQFIQAIPPHIVRVLSDFCRCLGSPLAILIAALAIAGLLDRRQRAPHTNLLLCMAAGSFLVFMLKRSIPFERTWIYFIPIVLIIAETGFASLNDRWLRLSPRVIVACMAIVSTAYAIWLANSDAVEKFPDTGTAPYAEAVADDLAPRISNSSEVCAELPADAPINYYLWLRLKSSGETRPLASSRAFFIRSISSSTPAAWDDQELQQIGVFGDLLVYDGRDSNWLADKPGWTCWHPALFSSRQ